MLCIITFICQTRITMTLAGMKEIKTRAVLLTIIIVVVLLWTSVLSRLQHQARKRKEQNQWPCRRSVVTLLKETLISQLSSVKGKLHHGALSILTIIQKKRGYPLST